MRPFPPHVAFRHLEARDGFEVAFLTDLEVQGSTSAVERGEPWLVHYELDLNDQRHPVRARVSGRSARGTFARIVETDGDGHWLIDAVAAPQLDGCFDVDLESSALTNAFAVKRLALRVGEERQAPAAYVRADDLRVERLEQTYRRLADQGGTQRYAYEAPAFGVRCELVFDDAGIIIDYPGLARRV